MADLIKRATDKTRSRTHVYKPDEVMVVYSEEAEQCYKEGWHDSPTAFFDMKAYGVEEDKEEELKEVIDGIKDTANDEINLEAMTTKQLKKYAKKNFPGLTYQKNAKKPAMLSLIKQTKKDIAKEEAKFLSDEDYETEAEAI